MVKGILLCLVLISIMLKPVFASEAEKFFEVVCDGDLNKVKEMVKKNPKLVKARGVEGQMPLSNAAFYGKNEIMAYLVSKGADVNARDDEGLTALHYAVRWGGSFADKNTITFLISKGADVNAKTKEGQTPLLKSVILMDRGIVGRKMPEILLSRGADVNAADKTGTTPLLYVVSDGQDENNEVARFLISKGAQVKVKGMLIYSASHRDEISDRNFVTFLIGKGADVNEKDENGVTPLHKAAENGNKGIAEILISKGAKVNERDAHGKTSLQYADKEDKKMIELLMKHGGK